MYKGAGEGSEGQAVYENLNTRIGFPPCMQAKKLAIMRPGGMNKKNERI